MGALLVAVTLGTLPMIGAANGNQRLMRVASTASFVQFMLVGGSLALLTWSFVVQDFSVEYVARNSNASLPMEYRFSAVWGAHEGSLCWAGFPSVSCCSWPSLPTPSSAWFRRPLTAST